MDGIIYLDNAATSFPKPDVVHDSVRDFYSRMGVNPGRTGCDMAIGAEPKQLSREDEDLENGLFTAYLLEGIYGAAAEGFEDNIITIGRLEEYIFSKMAAYSRQNPERKQIPVSMGEASSAIPIAVIDPNAQPPAAIVPPNDVAIPDTQNPWPEAFLNPPDSKLRIAVFPFNTTYACEHPPMDSSEKLDKLMIYIREMFDALLEYGPQTLGAKLFETAHFRRVPRLNPLCLRHRQV